VARDLFAVGEIEYNLAHLEPFTINVTPNAPEAPTFKVLVLFSHHTFTREIKDGDDVAYHYIENNDPRCFCHDRYLSSQSLKAVVESSSGGKAYFSQNRNFMLIDQPLGGPPYAVFFNIERATKISGVSANMFVASAYEKPGLPARSKLPSISFATLVAKTVRSELIRKPKK
jgi:hypothetical protein